MLKGRYFTKKEYLAGQPLAIMGEKDAVRIFGSTDIVGKELDVTLYGCLLYTSDAADEL